MLRLRFSYLIHTRNGYNDSIYRGCNGMRGEGAECGDGRGGAGPPGGPPCYLQHVVGEVGIWTSGFGKSAAKGKEPNKQATASVKHKIFKEREFTRRVSEGEASRKNANVKPNPEEYLQEFGLKMDVDEAKQTPPPRAAGEAAGSAPAQLRWRQWRTGAS